MTLQGHLGSPSQNGGDPVILALKSGPEGVKKSCHFLPSAEFFAFCNWKNGTGEGTRTPTLVKEADFESAASTNSATLALREVYAPLS